MEQDDNFGSRLDVLRTNRGLTVQQLARLSRVSQPLISNLLNNRRVIGEYTARKIGAALQLQGLELENFVYQAINNCTEKVLNSSKDYPSEILNLLAGELNALGIAPDKIAKCVRRSGINTGTALHLSNGQSAFINIEVAIV